MPRTILHADMDAFFAAIEQRDHPELRGRPVIVGGLGRRGVVATASYEARRYGVHSAMPTAVARRKCKDGAFVPPRMAVYAEVAAVVGALMRELTPLVEPLSLDEAFLDVTGCGGGVDGATLAAELKRRVLAATQLTVSVGVAASKYVAKVASDLEKPDGLVVVPPGEERAFLAPLPVKRLWGAGPVAQRRFAEAGLLSIGDVQRQSQDALVALFGAAMGAHFHTLAHGVDPRRVEADRASKTISQETTFEHDLRRREECHSVLRELAAGVGRRLRAEALRAGTVRLKVRFAPFETHSRQCALEAPVDDDLAIAGAAVELFDRAWPALRPVRLLGVGAAGLADAAGPVQLGLFDGVRAKRASRLDAAVDAIRAKFGGKVIGRGGAGSDDGGR